MPYGKFFECVSVHDICLFDVAKDAYCSFVLFTKLFSTYSSMHPNDVGTPYEAKELSTKVKQFQRIPICKNVCMKLKPQIKTSEFF